MLFGTQLSRSSQELASPQMCEANTLSMRALGNVCYSYPKANMRGKPDPITQTRYSSAMHDIVDILDGEVKLTVACIFRDNTSCRERIRLLFLVSFTGPESFTWIPVTRALCKSTKVQHIFSFRAC